MPDGCLIGALLFLSATGLTWSHYAGAHFSALLDKLYAHAPVGSTDLPGAAPATGADSGGAYAGHHAAAAASTDTTGYDRTDRRARRRPSGTALGDPGRRARSGLDRGRDRPEVADPSRPPGRFWIGAGRDRHRIGRFRTAGCVRPGLVGRLLTVTDSLSRMWAPGSPTTGVCPFPHGPVGVVR
jgi:uncharacterized iron-regulated membrane protein